MSEIVYESGAFKARVDFAASYISGGRRTTRAFDTCFEMHDGDAVAVALYRRAQARPETKLAQNLPRYLNEASLRETAERDAHIATRDLPKLAAMQRMAGEISFGAFLRDLDKGRNAA